MSSKETCPLSFQDSISPDQTPRLAEADLDLFCSLCPFTVRTTRPVKCDIFSQRYQSQPITKKFQKHCLYFLNLQKPCQNISLQNIMHNFLSAVYRKNLSIRTDRTDKTVKTLIRLLLKEQSDQGLHCLSFYLLHLHIILQRKPKLFNFKIFFNTYIRCSDSKSFHLKIIVDSLWVQKMITLGSYSYNNVSFRSSRKPENQMKSCLVC